MSAGVTLVVFGAVLALLFLEVLVWEPRLYRRRHAASSSIQRECERIARANARPRGNCDITYGGRKLP